MPDNLPAAPAPAQCESVPRGAARGRVTGTGRPRNIAATREVGSVDALELVGWVGSAVLVWSLLQTRILRLRVINLVGCVILIVYNGVAGVWPILGLNVVLAIINIYYLRSLLSTRHSEASYDVVQVDADDA